MERSLGETLIESAAIVELPRSSAPARTRVMLRSDQQVWVEIQIQLEDLSDALTLEERLALHGEEITVCLEDQDPVSVLVTFAEADRLVGQSKNSPFVVGAKERPATAFRFDLMNFPEAFYLPSELESEKYRLKLRPEAIHPHASVRADRLRRGFVLTHRGRLSAIDDELSFDDVERLRIGLYLFFSFCRASLCAPFSIRAEDSGGSILWESHGSPIVAENPSAQGWYDGHHPESLSLLFAGFMRRWEEEEWVEPLMRSIYWYSRACRPDSGSDGALVFAQCGLEVVSWARLVSASTLVDQKGFKGLTAAGQMRLLLGVLGIPTQIPDELEKLAALARSDSNVTDGPSVLTLVRNSLVHPPSKPAPVKVDATFEALKLALYYLELSLLGVCGYSGEFGNRLRQRHLGESERVPWTVE